MAIPLTVGKYRVPAGMQAPAVSQFSYRPMAATQGGGQPGSQYGGDYQYPGAPATGAPPITYTTAGGTQGQVPTIKLPEGTAGTPAYTPDYSSMIGGSWEVGAAESAMASQMAAARAAFQKQLRSSFIDLGYTGDVGKDSQFGDFSKYIDKDTIQKAIDNKYSAYAQVKQQEDKSNAYNAAMLASSGLALGGTATGSLQDVITQGEQARYEGLRNFLSGGEQGLSNLTQMKAQLAAGVAQARFAAAQRLAAMYPPTPAVPATQPDYNDFWGSYQGGVWAMPGQGNGWIVPAGNATANTPSDPWYVGPGSGLGDWGNMPWTPHI